jgi:hypothetical protein
MLKRFVLLTLIILTLVVTSMVLTSCEPPLTLDVSNQTDQIVTMYVNGYKYFDVPPSRSIKSETVTVIYNSYFIEALNQEGQIVYSRIFDRSQYQVSRINIIVHSYTFPIVITPSESNPYLPLEVENKTDYVLYIYVNDTEIGELKPNTMFKKRPLSSVMNSFTITAETYDKHASGDWIYKKIFSINDFKNLNWDLVISNSDITFR